MTRLQHETWMRVAAASKRRRWFVAETRSEKAVLGHLFRRGYFQRRRSDGAYRLFGLWPAPYRWPSWTPAGDRLTPHSWWPPYWPAR